MDGDHDGLRQLRKDAKALVDPADALVVVAHLLRRRTTGDSIFWHPKVDPGAERSALSLDDEHADPLIESDLVGTHPELS